MPVIRIQRAELERMLPEISVEEFAKRIPMIGADFKGMNDEEIHVEFFPNRPDLFTVEGIVRAAKGFFEIELGLPNYHVDEADIVLEVDESVLSVRPYIGCALVKDVYVDEYAIKSFMEAQEKLHITYGRKRKKVAIGLHDFSKIKPPFRYIGADPDKYSFVPLGMDREMTLRDILRNHPKGREYGWIIEKSDVYPLIVDSEENVLSMPPIINGTLTEITEETRNIFIDVTGTDRMAVENILNILATALAERGGKIYSCLVKYPSENRKLPDLNPLSMDVDVNYIRNIIGMDLAEEDIVHSLMKMRHFAEISDGSVKVLVGRFRVDIMDKIDVVEEIAIGYGYDRIPEKLPERFTVGNLMRITENSNIIRRLLVGAGYQEICTLTLTSRRNIEGIFGIKGDFVEIVNPVSEDLNVVRPKLLPNLLMFLADNTHREYPQRVFEIGRVVLKNLEHTNVAGVTAHTKASFSEVKSVVQKILSLLGIDAVYEDLSEEYYIEGRAARIIAEGKVIGEIGEIHPRILEELEIYNPVAAFEINIDALRGMIK